MSKKSVLFLLLFLGLAAALVLARIYYFPPSLPENDTNTVADQEDPGTDNNQSNGNDIPRLRDTEETPDTEEAETDPGKGVVEKDGTEQDPEGAANDNGEKESNGNSEKERETADLTLGEAISQAKNNSSNLRSAELAVKAAERRGDEEEIRLAEKQVHEAARKVEQATGQAYLEVWWSDYLMDRLEKYIGETEAAIARVRRQVKIGRSEEAELEALKDELENHFDQRREISEDRENSGEDLSALTGTTLEPSTVLYASLPRVRLADLELDEMIKQAQGKNPQLLEATWERKETQKKVLELMDAYEARGGKEVEEMNEYLQDELGAQVEKPGVRLDYDYFMENYYQPALDSIGDYFEDEEELLFTALIEREEAFTQEEEIKDDLARQVRSAYREVHSQDAKRRDAERQKEQDEDNYREALRQHRIGKITFPELHAAKMKFFQQEDQLYEKQIEYSKALFDLNLYTEIR